MFYFSITIMTLLLFIIIYSLDTFLSNTLVENFVFLHVFGLCKGTGAPGGKREESRLTCDGTRDQQTETPVNRTGMEPGLLKEAPRQLHDLL